MRVTGHRMRKCSTSCSAILSSAGKSVSHCNYYYRVSSRRIFFSATTDVCVRYIETINLKWSFPSPYLSSLVGALGSVLCSVQSVLCCRLYRELKTGYVTRKRTKAKARYRFSRFYIEHPHVSGIAHLVSHAILSLGQVGLTNNQFRAALGDVNGSDGDYDRGPRDEGDRYEGSDSGDRAMMPPNGLGMMTAAMTVMARI